MAQRSWKEIVDKSNGSLVYVPDKFKDAVKKWADKRDELNKFVNTASKLEIETTVALQNVVLDLRNYFAENGVDDIWTQDVGIETNALKEGEFVLTIGKNRPESPMPPMQE